MNHGAKNIPLVVRLLSRCSLFLWPDALFLHLGRAKANPRRRQRKKMLT